MKPGTLPWRTLLLCGGALLAWRCPALGALLVYDRLEVDAGQCWRLLSGSLVHFSVLHLGLDLIAVLVAGSLIERRGHPSYWSLCLGSAACIGVAVQLLRPDLRWYGGLSGVAVAMVAWLCLWELAQEDCRPGLYGIVLLLLAAKILLEFATGSSLGRAAGDQAYQPLPLAHAAGALAAAALFLLRRGRARPVPPRLPAMPECAGSSRGSSAARRSNPSRRPGPGAWTPC